MTGDKDNPLPRDTSRFAKLSRDDEAVIPDYAPKRLGYPPHLGPANDNTPSIIAFTGLAGSGKSTAADYLVGKGYTRVKFAGPLKAMCRAIGLTDEHIEGRLKEEPCELLQGKTPRQAMQALGTEWGRDCIGSNFWVGLWRAEATRHHRVVCDDCRFENEATVVRDMGGIVVRLEGRGGIAGKHASEAGVKPDVVIRNVHGIADLYERIDEVLAGAADERRAA